MSGSVADRKRLIRVTAEDVLNRTIHLDGHSEFFRGSGLNTPSRGSSARPIVVEISAEPAAEPIRVQLPKRRTEKEAIVISGAGVEAFLIHHAINIGDVLAFERTTAGRFRLYPFESRGARDTDWQRHIDDPLEGTGPTVLELFAGCGGMAYGFKLAGFRTLLAVEWDAAACETLRANITSRVAQCSIQEIDSFPRADVIAGGPPCQGFSNLGEKVPDDPRNQLWKHYMRAVEDVEPSVFVMENVPPLLASQEYVEIKEHAKSLGYEVEGRVLNAADYGVPQTRKRAIIIGTRGIRPSFPDATHFGPAERDLFSSRRSPWITVRQAIGDLPLEPTGENWHIGRNPTPMSLERYRHVSPGGNRWDLPDRLMPECWKRKIKGGTDLFGRLWWDRPSVTIRTEFYKPEKGRYLHPEADRPITHREAARLQGFPDSFDFLGKRIQVGIQIGNACPPPLATVLAHHLASMLQESSSSRAPA